MTDNTLFDKWNKQTFQVLPRTKERVLNLIKQASWDSTVKEHIVQIVREYNKQNPSDQINGWE